MDQMDGFCAQPGSETRHIANQSQISAPLRLEFRCAVSIALSYSLYLKMSSLTLGGQFIKGCKISSNSHQCFGSKATAFLDYAGSQPWKRVTKQPIFFITRLPKQGGCSPRTGSRILSFLFVHRVLLMRESGSWNSSYRASWSSTVSLSMCRISSIGLSAAKPVSLSFSAKSW